MEIKYYDERYYLSKLDNRERKILEYWKEKYKTDTELEKINNVELIYLYNEYVKLASKLINEISLDNSISKGLILSVLVDAGVFSYNNFKFNNVKDILGSHLGINVINGEGCCRNVSNFMTDVLNINGDFCENITVIQLTKRNKRKATREKANHMMNLINYDGVLYGFDLSTNYGSLYYFINSFELLPIEESQKIFIYYKPYIDFVYNYWTFKELKEKLELFNRNVGKRISEKEFKDIVRETDSKLEREIQLVQDFMKDTSKDVANIKEKIKIMK